MIASALAQAEEASECFCGSLVAYSTEVKHELLDVPPGPVVSADAADVMACRARELLLADLSVAVTGAGGPSTQDGHQPGTVFLAVDGLDHHDVVRLHLPGDPARSAQRRRWPRWTPSSPHSTVGIDRPGRRRRRGVRPARGGCRALRERRRRGTGG